jgi:DNA polymerase I
MLALSAFKEIIFCDFEFRQDPGERRYPVCLVARELHSGRVIPVWRDELLQMKQAPFDTGADSLFVAYYASAELSCFLALDWPMPVNVLDLYVEHRQQTNGIAAPDENSLLAALALRGLGAIDAGEKTYWRDLIMNQWNWSDDEKAGILAYCQTDVDALARLLPKMADAIDLPRALSRGRYMQAVARMEWAGVPIDVELHDRLMGRWEDIKLAVVQSVDQAYGVYEKTSFRQARFAKYLEAQDIPWERLPSGGLQLDKTFFRDQATTYPVLGPLYELRTSLARMRKTKLAIGPDGRNRPRLSPFTSVTGRNQPSNSSSIFGPSRWLRNLIRPEFGHGLAYVDWSSQEYAIAAALSDDRRMMVEYAGGDPYMSMAITLGLAPPDATKATHAEIREKCKTAVLGINYGMSAHGLALRLGVPLCEAKAFLRSHQRAYPRFWEWSEQVVDTALATRVIRSQFDWVMHLGDEPNTRALQNYPMQANGSEMMRLAAIAATEAGIEVCMPVHDAFVICAPLDCLDDTVREMRALMCRASEVVTGGLTVRTDSEVVRWPDHYRDKRGDSMWKLVTGLLGEGVAI